MELSFCKTKVAAMKCKTAILCYNKVDGMQLDSSLVLKYVVFLPLNSILIYKTQFHTNLNICDHIDLASLTLFLKKGYVCLMHFLGKFHPKNN